MTVSKISSNFANRVGGDGFFDIKRNKEFRRLVWILCVLVAWACFLYQCSFYTIKYLSFPIETQTELKFDYSMKFPAVTFCNLNPMKYSKLGESVVSHMMEDLDTRNASSGTDFMASKGAWDTSDRDEDASPENEEITKELQIQREFYENYYTMSEENQKNAGHGLDEMLVECIWKGEQCFPDDFTYYHHPKYGNCYAFNAGWTRTSASKPITKIKNTTVTGPSGGLSVMLMVQNDQYIPLLASSTGVRVHVHHQNRMPYPEDSGFTVSAGYSASLQMRKIIVTRMGTPYHSTGCGFELSASMKTKEAAEYWPRAIYTLTACMKYCYQAYLEVLCHCVDPRMQAPRGLSPCLVNDTFHKACMSNAAESFREGTMATECQNECPSACQDIDYQMTSASSPWPNDYYLDVIKSTYGNRNEFLARLLNDSDSEIYENLLQVNLYFERLNYEAITESESYKLTDLLSDYGGTVGFWIGMSVLAVCQCFEFFGEIFKYLCVEKRQVNNEGRRRRF